LPRARKCSRREPLARRILCGVTIRLIDGTCSAEEIGGYLF
jgi:hypothetical protein